MLQSEHLASCPCRVKFYGRISMGFSGLVSLISLSVCPFFHSCGLSYFTWALPVGGFFVSGFSPPAGLVVVTTPTLSCMPLYRCWLTKQY